MTGSFPLPPLPRVNWRQSTRDDSSFRAWLANEAPRKPWDKFVRDDFQPVPGEHVAIIGPTGQGKTVLMNNILPMFPFTVVFSTKPVDRSMDELINEAGYTRLSKWEPLNPIDHPRRVIWPDASGMDSVDTQKKVFKEAFDRAFRQSGRPAHNPVGWAIACDEVWYMTNMLNLQMEVKLILLQGRSAGISFLGATQRPAWVPVELYDQSTHLFFFRDNDERNLSRISEINARDKRMIKAAVMDLEPFQVLYINTRTGKMARTRAPIPKSA